jgi:peptidoglycan hydrolase-like protein with peptidoglycan-binding domain
MAGPVEVRERPAGQADSDGHAPVREPSGPGRRRRSVLILAAAGLLVTAGVAAWALLSRDGEGDAAASDVVATSTATVARRDLAETETFEGTLSFTDTRTLAAGVPGTITALAPEGSIRRRGQVLYRVDQRPVVLLIGSLPAWRALEEGAVGGDVLQLERNLEALGYDPGTIDREFDSDTEDAVESWQADLGVGETGVVEPADIVFSPTRVRVGAHATAVGQAAQGGVMEVSSMTQAVTVDLDVSDRELVAVGDEVSVELPNESVVTAAIVAIGKVAEAQAADAATGEESSPTVEVDIALPGNVSTRFDQAPVDVAVTTRASEGVLAVPVTALLALLGGGYAVEVVDGATTTLVPVEPGMYADGYVEIAAGDVDEGARVVVPSE